MIAASRLIARVMIASFALGVLAGCASYTTPPGRAELTGLEDKAIRKELERRPKASFPAHISVVRVQGSDYHRFDQRAYGEGRYSVITTRSVATDGHIKTMGQWPQVRGIAPINRMILPKKLDSVKSLRVAAAKVQADMLLAYTFDTDFRIDGHDIPPLEVITLGLLPNEEAKVTSTASAVIYDVRTGYIYGLGEASATVSELASAWDQQEAVDDAREDAERQAMDKLVTEMTKTWDGIVKQYAKPATAEARTGGVVR